MNNRWVLAATAAVGVGLLAVPMMIGRSSSSAESKPELMAAHDGASCQAQKANLEYTVKDMHGADVKLSDFKGKVILVNYWATWCGPCKVEIPEFIELYSKYKDKGLVILGVSADDDAETLRAYAAEMKMNYPVLVGRDHEDLLEAFGPLFGYPTSFVIGRDGSICAKHVGPATKEEFEKTIKALL
jgi:peroxiredoxin